MSKSFFLSVLFSLSLFSNVLFAQESNSIQLNVAKISPQSSTDGFSTSIQFNYDYSSTISFYVSLGYLSWDRFYVNFIEEWSPIQKETHFKTYLSDEHLMIPIYLGSKINFHNNKYFTSFVNVELGYSYMEFNSYDYWKSANPNTGEVVGYYADATTKKEIQNNILGIGLGLGISHPMSKNLNLLLAVKLNSNLYSEHSTAFYSRETYMSYSAGFSINI